MNDAINEFSGASLGASDLDARAQLRLDDPDLQFKEAMKAFNVAIGTQLLPAVTSLIPPLVELVPTAVDLTSSLAGFVQELAQNPFAGIGAIVAAKIGEDVISAGVGKGLMKLLSTQIGGAGGLIIGTAMITVSVLEMIMASKELDANKRLNAMDANGEAIRSQARSELDENGKLSPQTKARLEALKSQEDDRLAGKKFNDPLKGVSAPRELANDFTFGLTGPTTFNDETVTNTVDKRRQGTNEQNDEKTSKLLEEAAMAINKSADALADASGKFRMGISDPARSIPGVAR